MIEIFDFKSSPWLRINNDYSTHKLSTFIKPNTCNYNESGDYAVAGAIYEVSDVFYCGAAYIYARNEGGTDNCGEVAKLTTSNPQNDAQFGYSIVISGDYVVVGALLEDDTGTGRRAIYIF